MSRRNPPRSSKKQPSPTETWECPEPDCGFVSSSPKALGPHKRIHGRRTLKESTPTETVIPVPSD